MHWLLHIPGQPAAVIGESPMRIGSDPASEIHLTHSDIAGLHARLLADSSGLLWLEVGPDQRAAVHVNGRRIKHSALLQPGDELHLGSCALRLSSMQQPDVERRPTEQLLNYAERVLLRTLTGAGTGRAHVLVNSLCIGRSSLSEICLDDTALAERQILLQRQGNEILVKNLSPVLEMRIDGWVCEEALLQPGSQLTIEQHRFRLEAPCAGFLGTITSVTESEVRLLIPDATVPDAVPPRIFTAAQWMVLATAAVISVFFIILLFFSP